jgi:8-oxo-dGTP diphosphatase
MRGADAGHGTGGTRPDQRDTGSVTGPRIPCVGAIIADTDGRLLLIKRGRDPEAGRWSLPGGRIEAGETDEQALAREVREETGLVVRPGPLAGAVERPGPGGTVLDIRDYTATVTGGTLVPGDDAADARWVSPDTLTAMNLTSGLLAALTEWGVLPAPPAPALVAEATRRAGVIWLSVPGHARPYPAWHIWHPTPARPNGAAYLVTGTGEQPLPGLAAGGRVTVTVASKETGGAIVSWPAGVHRVEPGSAEWDAVAGPLAAARLNAVLEPGEASPAGRWARSGSVFCLVPAPPAAPVTA